MKLKVLAFDCEMLPTLSAMPNPEHSPIMLISFAGNYNIMDDKKKVIFVLNRSKDIPEGVQIRENDVIVRFNDERRLIHGWELLSKDCDVIAGYNTSGFDIPYIIDRAKALSMSKLIIGNADDTLWHKKHISKGLSVQTIGGAKGKIIFDVLYLLRRADESNTIKKEYNLKSTKLEWTSKEVLKKEKKEFPIEKMIEYWEHGTDENKFIEYCSVDSELALEFITKFRLLDKFIMLSKESGKITQDIIDSQGFGSLVENLLMKEFGKIGRVVPCRGKSTFDNYTESEEDELAGAFVLEPKLGITDNIVSGDYSCCVGDTLILTNNGLIKIKDIVDIKDNEIIFTNSFKEGEFSNKEIIDFKNIGVESTKKITLENGYEIEGSTNHRILTIKDGNGLFAELKDLKVNDVVVLNKGSNVYGNDVIFDYSRYYVLDTIQKGQYGGTRHITIKTVYDRLFSDIHIPNKVTPEFAEFFGYMISDGYVSNTHVNMGFTQKDITVFERFIYLYNTLFKRKNIGKSMSLFEYLDDIKIEIKNNRIENLDIQQPDADNEIIKKLKSNQKGGYEFKYRYKGGHEVTVLSVDLKRLFRYYGFDGNSYEKEVPWCILQSSKECQCAFLMTLFEGDGCASKLGKDNSRRISYISKSKKLCYQIQSMLLNMGIISDIDYIESSNDYKIQMTGYNCVLYYKNIGFVSERKILRNKTIVNSVMGYDYTTNENEDIEIDFDKISKKDKTGNKFPLELGLNNILKILHSKYVKTNSTNINYVCNRDDPSFFRTIYRYINNNDIINIMILKKYLKMVEYLKNDENYIKLKWFSECNMSFLRIQKIEDNENKLYDISVDITHNYVSNGFISHNSLYPSLMRKNNICYTTVILDNSIPDNDDMVIVKNDEDIVMGRFIKPSILKGVIPSLQEGLMSKRALLKTEMKKYEKGTIDYLMYDASQNAAKILLNTFYGHTGEQSSKLYCYQVASSVTGSGRKQIKYTIEMIDGKIVSHKEKNYKLKVVAGDSVTKDIPILFFEDNNGLLKANIFPISELYDYYYGNGKYNTLSKYMDDKKDIYVEGRNGLVLLKGVHKHKVSKKGYKVSTCCGLTKVTEDHSLFRNGKEIKPTDIRIGSYIDTTDIYNIINDDIKLVKGLEKDNIDLAWVLGLFVADGYCNCTCEDKWGIKYVWNISQKDEKVLEKCKIILDKYYKGKYKFKIIDILKSSNVHRLDVIGDVVSIVKEYRNYFYTDDTYGYKKIPEFILNSDKECVKAFLEGYYLGDGYINETGNQEFTTNSLTLFKGLEFLNIRLQNRISRIKIDSRTTMKVDKKTYVCKDRKESYNGTIKNIFDKYNHNENTNTVRYISEFDIKNENVYDLTTDDKTFVCGLGNILHHNTDSVYVQVISENVNEILSREIVVDASSIKFDEINATLEKPMKLAFENYIKRMLVIAKKRYAMVTVDEKGKELIIKKGIESVRRDWSDFSTDALTNAVDIILHEDNIDVGTKKIIEFVQNEADRLRKGNVDIQKLTLSKKLTKLITLYDNNAIHVKVAIKMKERGRPSEVGDRISYIIIDNGKELIGDKAEEADYIINGKCKDRIDYEYYVNKQLVPPIGRILEVLGSNKNLLLMDRRQKTMMDY